MKEGERVRVRPLLAEKGFVSTRQLPEDQQSSDALVPGQALGTELIRLVCEQVKLVFRKQLSNDILLEVAHLPARLSPHGAAMFDRFSPFLCFAAARREPPPAAGSRAADRVAAHKPNGCCSGRPASLLHQCSL